MKSIINLLFASALLFNYSNRATAQDESSSPILFIYDASGSMWGQLEGKTKKEIAATVLSTTIGQLSDAQKIGLMAYGHRKKGDCEDVELMLDLDNSSKDDLVAAIKGISPLGRTPLAHSARLAIDHLRTSKKKATIILVTDGIESCEGDICKVITDAKNEGIDFKLHIVGFGLKEADTKQLRCAAQAGDGQYYSATDAGALGDVLNEATTKTVDDPPGNFSIYATKNGEAVDAWIKAYPAGTQELVDKGRTYKDSAFIFLPPGRYDLFVQPLENTDITGTTISIEIKAGETQHRDLSFDGATFDVYTTNNHEGWDALARFYNQATGKQAASARTYGKNKSVEVDPGLYQIVLKGMKMKGPAISITLDSIEIKAGTTQKIQHNFETGIAMIGAKTADGQLLDVTIRLTEKESGEKLSPSRTYTDEKSNPKQFILTPGHYIAKIAGRGEQKGQSKTVDIIVGTGKTVEEWVIF